MAESGSEAMTGEFGVTLDDKCRINLPASLRKALNETNLFLTKGTGKYLWLYPPAKWNKMKDDIMENTNPFSEKDLRIRRRFLGSSVNVEIDKAGRIPVSASLREFAGLSKECVVVGQVDYIEIWSHEYFEKYQASEEEVEEASEEFGALLKSKQGEVK